MSSGWREDAGLEEGGLQGGQQGGLQEGVESKSTGSKKWQWLARIEKESGEEAWREGRAKTQEWRDM